MHIQSWSKIFRPIASRFTRKNDISSHMESLNFQSGNDELLKIEKWLEDWPLGCHPARNGHVTH